MRLLYTHQNLILVENMKNVIEAGGVSGFTKNALLSSGFGELSGIDTWPELWISHDEDYKKAMSLIEPVMEAPLSAADCSEWQCPNCKEANATTFNECWNCQTFNP